MVEFEPSSSRSNNAREFRTPLPPQANGVIRPYGELTAAPSPNFLDTTLHPPPPDPKPAYRTDLVDSGAQPPAAQNTPVQDTQILASQNLAGAVGLFQPRLFIRALREVWEMHANALEQWSNKLNLSPAKQALAVAATAAALTAGAHLSPSTTLGLVGSAIILNSIGHEHNIHSRAQGIIGGVLYTSHLGLIGAWEGVVSSCVGITRNLLQSMIPDSHTTARVSFALVSLGASVSAFMLLTDPMPMVKISNLPLLATCLSSISGAFNVRFSWASRLCGFVAGIACVPYHALEGSNFGLALCVLGLANLCRTIHRHDVGRLKGNSCQS